MKRILLAEDDPPSRELLRELLERWGYQVEEASDGGEAVAKIKELLPDLAIVDIQMPVLDGFSVLHAVRADERLDNMPILALTAFAMDGDKEKSLLQGFTGYHSKPLNSKLLRAALELLLA